MILLALPGNAQERGCKKMEYKAIVVEYEPRANKLANAVESKSNLMAAEGWELITFSVTNSAKAILVFGKPGK